MRTTWLCLVVAGMGCMRTPEATDGPEPEGDPVNQAPTAPTAYTPVDGAEDLPLSLELGWSPATDPDGDAITYTVRLDAGTVAMTEIVTGLNDVVLALDELQPDTEYAWQVVAVDAQGMATEGPTSRFTTQAIAIAVSQGKAAWPGRYGFGAVVHDGRLWVIGGANCCGGFMSDVWSSPDGVTWTEEVTSAPWGPRGRHQTVVHEGRIYVFGGISSFGAGSEYADVWSSDNGVDWVQETANAAFLPRDGAESASFGGRLWLLGGTDLSGTALSFEVWSSVDGATWVPEAAKPAAARSELGEAVVFDDALWYIAGLNDNVSYTDGGSAWVRTTGKAPFGARLAHAAAVHDGRMWLISGSIGSDLTELPDVWYSSDGEHWVLASADAGFEPMAYAQAVSFQGKLWFLGGGGGYAGRYVTNEVYTLSP